jgi:tripartite-type tricarboxylate transporter receptor subunit TctC
MAGVDITHVPYKGSGPAVTDLIGGQVQVMFDNISNVLPHVKSGKLKVLAVTTPARSPLLPEVPTVAESGVPGYEVAVWFGLAAPAGTPRPVIDKLNDGIVNVLKQPDVKAQFAALGVEAVGTEAEAFAAHIAAQRTMWSKVVRDAGVTPE